MFYLFALRDLQFVKRMFQFLRRFHLDYSWATQTRILKEANQNEESTIKMATYVLIMGAREKGNHT